MCLYNYFVPLSSNLQWAMLKSKLKRAVNSAEPNTKTVSGNVSVNVSGYFSQPFWSKFYDVEVELNDELRKIKFPKTISHVYNPIEYAADLHCSYLRKFLKGPKSLIFLGMNPGPNGMGQTGVPFGNIKTVKELMRLDGSVQQPPKIYPKRPVTGLDCLIEEPSGVRFWGVLNNLSGGLDNFAANCFVHNFCPLGFFDAPGKNITPSELKWAMLKSKLKRAVNSAEPNTKTVSGNVSVNVSGYFSQPFWSKFYDVEVELNDELRKIKFPKTISHVYNPIEYAADLHCSYLRKFLKGPKSLIFLGMNPGPNGMGQTGVPFGNIKTVKELMRLDGSVQQPPKIHPKRPVTGLDCLIEEPSGVRFWGVLNNLSGGLDNFAANCFVHNFCPLGFFDAPGKNITPSELKGETKKVIRDTCLEYFEKELELLKPSIIVAVGSFVYDSLKTLSAKHKNIKFMKLAHPSPRSLNNTNWPEKAELWFTENDLIKHLQKET